MFTAKRKGYLRYTERDFKKILQGEKGVRTPVTPSGSAPGNDP